MSSKTSAVAHAHGDLAKDAKDLHKQHQKSVAAEKAHSDSRKMNLKTTAATTVPNDESEKAPPAADPSEVSPVCHRWLHAGRADPDRLRPQGLLGGHRPCRTNAGSTQARQLCPAQAAGCGAGG